MNLNKHNLMELLIIILLMIVIAIILYVHFWSHAVVQITDESLILVFVGIIATFIVVGNAQQVREIRNDMHEELRVRKQEVYDHISDVQAEINEKYDGLEQKISSVSTNLNELKSRLSQDKQKIDVTITTIHNDIEQLKDQTSSIKIHNDEIENKIHDIENLSNSMSQSMQDMLHGMLNLLQNDTSKLVLILLYSDKIFYNVQLSSGETKQAIRIYENDQLRFVEANTRSELNNIKKIEDLKYDSECVNELYCSVMRLLSNESEVLSHIDNDIPPDSVS